MHLYVESLISLLQSDYASRLNYLAELELEATWTIEPPPHPKLAGTKIFMAIGALLGEPHNFMHDLESFFWVLFWICIHYEGRNKKGEVQRRIIPQFEDWNYLSTEKLASQKDGWISKRKNFTEHCKPLIPCMRELHRVVFPNGSPWPLENRELYSDMKRTLEKARDNMGPKNVQ